ncbi:head GIN domain-containing protein [Chitinophaga sp. GbtcB8]|uniref:head GIN domain-containing protein n=1 Tax=Chitinophaga sp. GbtcB8 TaxID=2824753 RepID=UPI001C2FF177|nr:head GIN domain-containing protein [Chitinophaga sp. GbtcB8]
MKSKLPFLLLLAIPLCVASCDVTGQNRVKGSGNVSKEERSVGEFKTLSVKGSMNVYVTQGPVKSAVIEAEDNIIPLILLEKEGDELVIRTKPHTNIDTKRDMKVYVTTPDLSDIRLAGSGDIKLENQISNRDAIEVSVSGSGNVSGALNAPHVKGSISGSGDMSLSGESKELEIGIAGSGNFKGEDLMAETANINIAGSGNANVHASVTLDAKIAGSGNVYYKGSPQVSSKVVGSGSVIKQ